MGFLILILLPILLGIYAQMKVHSTYGKWQKVASRSGMTGAQAAKQIMSAAGINDVQIVEIAGQLTDHYDPSKKTLALSSDNYRGTSLASLGVSAHEAGHAIQHHLNYAPLNLRMMLVPMTSFASKFLPVFMFGGFLFMNSLLPIYIGIAIYMVFTLFQLVTLPVEYNASTRAKQYLEGVGILDADEMKGVKQTLDAAAFTYLAAFLTSLGWLLHLLMIVNGRRD